MAEATSAMAAQRVLEDSRWRRTVGAVFSPMELTGDRPFCAGVLIVRDDRLLVTLSADGVDALDADGASWFVGGVGGGQEQSESLWDCARREALEELGISVELCASPVTYMHDINTGAVVPTRSSDSPAPFAVQRLLNRDAGKPFRPGLPFGPYTYFGLFLARIPDEEAVLRSSDDDVAALVWLPLSSWSLLDSPISFRTLLAAGASIAAGGPISPDAVIHIKDSESLRTVAPLLAAFPIGE